jgi:hypothetical protein
LTFSKRGKVRIDSDSIKGMFGIFGVHKSKVPVSAASEKGLQAPTASIKEASYSPLYLQRKGVGTCTGSDKRMQ